MSPPWEAYEETVADVQAIMSISLHPTILLAFCHGIHTCIFFLALYYIIESTQPNRKRITLAGIVTFLWFSNTVILGWDWNTVDQLFIAHGTSLEAEFNFYLTRDLAQVFINNILRVLSVLVADLILIWRCWVLYGGNLGVIAVPSLCVITEIISACMVIVSSLVHNGFYNAGQTNWTLVYYSMTVTTNSLCTFLILFRIVRVSGFGASLKTYRGVIEILVESAAMYAIIYIALLSAYAYQFYTGATVTTKDYAMMISNSITGVAPTLIIARVMAGQSRPNDSWTRPSLPHMRSDVLSATESLQFASAPNQSGTHTTTTDTGGASADIDPEAQDQEIVEEKREQDVGENRAEAGGSGFGDKQDVGKV